MCSVHYPDQATHFSFSYSKTFNLPTVTSFFVCNLFHDPPQIIIINVFYFLNKLAIQKFRQFCYTCFEQLTYPQQLHKLPKFSNFKLKLDTDCYISKTNGSSLLLKRVDQSAKMLNNYFQLHKLLNSQFHTFANENEKNVTSRGLRY